MKQNNIIALPVNELKTALLGLGKIIGRSRHVLPVLSAVRVARNAEGTVTLEGTNLDSTATFTFDQRNEGPAGELLVPLDRLQKAAKQTNGRIELSLNDKDEVTVRTFWRDTPIEEKMHVPYLDDFPAVATVEGGEVTLPENLRETLREAMECASEDESRLIINSVYLDVDDKKSHYVVSTNGRILFSANSFAFGFKQSVALPTRKFLAWNGWWTEGEATLAVRPPAKANEPGWIKLRSGQWEFVTRAIEGNYPNWKQVIPQETALTRIVFPPETIPSVLDIIAHLPGADLHDHDLLLNVGKRTLLFQGRSKDQPKPVSVPVVEATVEGREMAIALNREYLVKALRFGLNEISLIDELSPIVIRNGGKKVVIMPLRPDGVAVKPQPQPAPATPAVATTAPTETTTATQPVQNEERTDMPKTETTTTKASTAAETESALKQLMQQLESIKTALKNVVAELNAAADLLKRAEKEKKQSDKDIQAIREKLQDIQAVSI